MRELLPLKFIIRLLLVVMFTVTINNVHESAHAMQSHVSAAVAQTTQNELSAPHQCPCTPLEQNTDFDGCDTCNNCACHAPISVQPLQLSYSPVIVDLNTPNSFMYIQEVYFTKFIPPQIQA